MRRYRSARVVSFACGLLACSGSHGFDAGEESDAAIDASSSSDAGRDAGERPPAGTVEVHVTNARAPVADAIVWSSRGVVHSDAEGHATIEIAEDDFVSVLLDVADPPFPSHRWIRTWTGVAPNDVLPIEIDESTPPIGTTTPLRLDLVVPSAPPGSPADIPYRLWFCGGSRDVSPTPGSMELAIDPDCDASTGVELVLSDPRTGGRTIHGRASAPTGDRISWDPGASWVADSVPLSVAFPTTADEDTLVYATPLASETSDVPQYALGLSAATSANTWSGVLPPWATHTRLAVRELFADGRITALLFPPAPIVPAIALDRANVLSSATGAAATLSSDGTLSASWDRVDSRADLIVLALDLEGSSGTQQFYLNWQVMIAPSAVSVGPLPVPPDSWIASPSVRLSNVIVLAKDEWDGFGGARMNAHVAAWHLEHGAGAWTLAPLETSLE